MRLTEHFSLEEFTRSSTAKARGINNSLSPTAETDLHVIRNIKNLCAQVLEPLRNHISQPLVISSGYRSPRLNAAVGGAANSQHLTGQAADLRIRSVTEAREWMRWIMDNTTFDQLILEHNKSGSHWIHVSCKPNPEDNRHQVISTLLKKS